jgi:hypothetical protein
MFVMLAMIHSSLGVGDRDKFHPANWASSRSGGSDLRMHRASVDRWANVHLVMTGMIVVFVGVSHSTSTIEDALVTLSFDS